METLIASALSPPMPFSALLFDCDGTLVDTLHAYERAWTKAFGAHGVTMAPSWYHERTGLSPEALVEEAALEAGVLDTAAVQSSAIRHFVELVELVKSNEVTIEDVDRGKPAPDLYLMALRRLGVEPAECVAYEDTDEGIAAATAADIRCIDVRPILSPGP